MFDRVASRPGLLSIQSDSAGWTLLRQIGLALAGSVAIAAAAHVAVPLPFTPVPFTLQPLAVLLVGLLFGPALAFSTLCLYLLEGAAGLPVFQPLGLGGVAQLVGPTGGFLMAYPFVATLAGWLFRVVRDVPRFVSGAVAGTCATALLFALGAARLGTLLHLSGHATLLAAVVPFIPGEIVKVLAAAGVASAWQSRHIR
jgi:biotin transport system substrate-specific component